MCGVAEPVLHRLLCAGLPPLVFHVLKHIRYSRRHLLTEDLDFTEWFAGSQCVATFLRDLGLTGCGVDCLYDAVMQNIMTLEGFVAGIVLVLRLRSNRALQVFGTVCSSWIWIVRSVTHRSAAEPLGDRGHAFTEHGNVMVARVAILMLIGWSKGALLLLEQPSSSLMILHPRMQQVAQVAKAKLISTCMLPFGSPTEKRTILLSDAPWVDGLKRKGQKGNSEFSLATNDNGKVTGNRTRLKESQAYPAGFGKAVAELHRQWLADAPDTFSPIVQVRAPQPWPDAELTEVARALSLPEDIMTFPWQ